MAIQATRAKTERKPKLRTTVVEAEDRWSYRPVDNRDFAAELEALVHLTGGDFTPFIEIAKTDVGFIHEPDSLAAVNTLKGPEYARFVARLKKETKVRIAPFEAALAAAKGNGAGGGDDGMPGKPLTFDIIEPWPDQVDGEKLLTELSGAIGAYVIMDAEQRDAVALWAVFTHTHDLRDFAALDRQVGESNALASRDLAEIMSATAPRPLYIAGLTTAFIERSD